MAATSGATTTTSIVEIVESEYISRAILDANREPTVAEMMAWGVDASMVNSATYTFPKITAAAVPTSEASGKTQTDEFAATEQLLTEVQVSAATVGIRKALALEAMDDAIVDLVALNVRENALEMRDQIDEDWLSNITSATNTANFTGLDLTIARFGSALATFRAQNPVGASLGFVGSETQIDDLKADIRATSGAIFGGEFGNQAAQLLDARARGFLGVYEGVSMFTAHGNVPATSGDDNGALMTIGDRGAIALVVWRPITTEFQPELLRLQLDIVTHARYGSGITDNGNLLEVVSANT
jgi:hypothetical protein